MPRKSVCLIRSKRDGQGTWQSLQKGRFIKCGMSSLTTTTVLPERVGQIRRMESLGSLSAGFQKFREDSRCIIAADI